MKPITKCPYVVYFSQQIYTQKPAIMRKPVNLKPNDPLKLAQIKRILLDEVKIGFPPATGYFILETKKQVNIIKKHGLSYLEEKVRLKDTGEKAAKIEEDCIF